MFDTVIDLNDKTVFNIWLTIAVVTFVISLTTYNNYKFIIRSSSKFDPDFWSKQLNWRIFNIFVENSFNFSYILLAAQQGAEQERVVYNKHV